MLDARDPEGCRSLELEQQILKANKKVLLVLNKIDLVPPMNCRAWQKYLRREFPCILFKANTQNQSTNLSANTTIFKKSLSEKSDMVKQMTQSATAIGTDSLMNILKNYARVDGT